VKDEIVQKLAQIVGSQAEQVDVHYRVEFGRVAPNILTVASDTGTDLIVLGVRPSSGLLDRFMWPIAYELVRDASCPVLTIRGKSPAH
jgi:nucleotide-binding universal stress UspA family protein